MSLATQSSKTCNSEPGLNKNGSRWAPVFYGLLTWLRTHYAHCGFKRCSWSVLASTRSVAELNRRRLSSLITFTPAVASTAISSLLSGNLSSSLTRAMNSPVSTIRFFSVLISVQISGAIRSMTLCYGSHSVNHSRNCLSSAIRTR